MKDKVFIGGIEYVPKPEPNPEQPKPLLSDAKVGWICKRRDGKYFQIDRLCSIGGMPWICYEIGGLRYINSGEQLYTKDRSLDIISCEPLATEGSAEWGKQRALLGNIVTLTHNEIYKIENGKLYEAFPNNDFDVWRLVAEDGVGYWDKWIHDQTGWQIYEPAPRLKVGEWVSHKNRQGRVYESEMGCGLRIQFTDGDNPQSITLDIHEPSLRKLNPSEVKVTLTLEGTVRKCAATNGMGFEVFDADGSVIAWVSFASVPPAQAEMVRELVKD